MASKFREICHHVSVFGAARQPNQHLLIINGRRVLRTYGYAADKFASSLSLFSLLLLLLYCVFVIAQSAWARTSEKQRIILMRSLSSLVRD